MSIDIQKQVNFRAQNNNVINAPQLFTNEEVQQPVDEEKSNAAKWMIGLTATAAIVIGGIWAAKKGHLGKTAEKYANKLFGTTDSVKPKPETGSSTASQSSASHGVSTGASSITPPTASTGTTATAATAATATAIALLARKSVRKIIKSPKNISETIQSLQDAGVSYTKKGNSLLIKTGETVDDMTTITFNDSGVLTSIFKPFNIDSREVFIFNNGKLKSISKFFNTKKNFIEPLQQKIEFDDAGKTIKEVWTGRQDTESLIHIERRGENYYTDYTYDLRRIFAENFDELPAKLKKAKIYHSRDIGSDQGTYLTARVAKYWDTPISEIPKEIPTHELVRQVFGLRYKEFYDNLYNRVELTRNIASRCIDAEPIQNEKLSDILLKKSNIALEPRTKEQIFNDLVKLFDNDKTGRKAEIFKKLLEDDIGTATSFTNVTVDAVYMYAKKFNTYKLNTDIDLMETSVKPLKDCSYDDVVRLIKHIAPDKVADIGVVKDPWKNKEQEQKAIFTLLKNCTGQSNIDENTKLFDLLKDIAI